MLVKKKVLIFEDDDEQMRQLWRTKLQDKLDVIFVTSVDDLELEFVDNLDPLANLDLAAIVVAPHHTRNVIRTKLLLEKEIRPNFGGSGRPVIVTTSHPDTKEILLTAGCNCWCEKEDLATVLLGLLGE